MMPRLLCFNLALTLTAVVAADETWTQSDLLHHMIDLERLAAGPVNEQPGELRIVKVPTESDEWHDVGTFAGPGLLTRVWCARPAGMLRITLDDQPTFQLSLEAMVAGKLTPFPPPYVTRHGALLFPLGFENRCQVEVQGDVGTVLAMTARLPAGSRVTPFAQELNAAATESRDRVQRALRGMWPAYERSGARRLMPVMVAKSLRQGGVLRETVAGAGTVRAFHVALATQRPPEEQHALHQCVLRIYFDGEETPRVAAPLSDFFGAGPRWAFAQGLPIGTSRMLPVPLEERPHGGRFMYCDFPMPYRDGVRVEIERLGAGDMPLDLLLYMQVDLDPPTADALRFHARFVRAFPCEASFDFTAPGPGRLVGCLFNVASPRADWRADTRVLVRPDSAPKPVMEGSFGHVFEQTDAPTPRVGVLLGWPHAGPFGRSTASRWLVADAVPFSEQIKVGLRLTPGMVAAEADVSAVVYWYGAAGGEFDYRALSLDDLTPVGLRIPNAIEIEDHINTRAGWRVVQQRYAAGAELSRGKAAYITSKRAVPMTIPTESPQTAVLYVRTHPTRPFESFTVLDAEEEQVGQVRFRRGQAGGLYRVGVVELEGGANRIGVRCTSPVVLDCWLLTPVAEPASDGT